MLDIVDPFYWKDKKYPKKIFEVSIDTHPIYDKNLVYKLGENKTLEYYFLIPIPIRVIEPTLAFVWYWEKGKWGDMTWNMDEFRKDVSKKGSVRMVEELKDYWGDTRHLGWSWMYPIFRFVLPKYMFYKFNRFKFFSNIIDSKEKKEYKNWKGFYLLNKNAKRVKTAFEKESKLLSPYADEIFEDFPMLLLSDLDSSFKQAKEINYLPWTDMCLNFSYILGFLPTPTNNYKINHY